MRDPGNIEQVASLEPDYMGFIFYEKSKRFAGKLDPASLSKMPENIGRVGVFVNHDLKEVVKLSEQFSLNLLQLHGNESVAYVRELKQLLQRTSIKLMKAFGIDENFDFTLLNEYEKEIDYFLFDTQTPDHGGSGKQFNWELLNGYTLDQPYFLSGGIGLEIVEALKTIDDQRLFAIDVNSKFETEPGIKDISKLKEFKRQL
ncbi:MAG: phosphoribosylanthranilate isomerase [Pedobacter sp.]|nr:MAG: phosphoribosylanthranilate isomerase [Pedobacter sp.]